MALRVSRSASIIVKPRQCRLYTRPHPLSSSSPPRPSHRQQSNPATWSTGALLATATVVGTIMHFLGRVKAFEPKETVPTSAMVTSKQFEEALNRVRNVLPDDCVSLDRQVLIDHSQSSWTYHECKSLTGAVLYPRSTEDVVNIVKICSEFNVPIIPFCGGTSLEGQFNPPEYLNVSDGQATESGFCFTLDFSERMNQILTIHEQDLDCVVQPGVRYESLNEELKTTCEIPLFFPVDPGPGAQIGGMVGTGCSGTNAVRYGTMRENVINMTVVLADGTIMKTRQRSKKSSAGPNLGNLFIGSEGTLGIVTEITLKLQPLLPTSVGISSFPTVEMAARAVIELLTSGVGLTCIELLDDEMMKAINHAKSTRFHWDERPSLFLKFSGTKEQMKFDQNRTSKIVRGHGGSRMKCADEEKEVEELWQARKVALWSSLEYVSNSKAWTTDVCVPISNLPELVKRSKLDLLEHQLKSTIVGHAGDGNFHAIILFRNEEELRKTKACVTRMVRHAQDLDGTCTGEHGVGIGKIWALERELGPGTIKLLQTIKDTLDPKHILNPGKLIPPREPSNVK